jgi:hypothetical protein
MHQLFEELSKFVAPGGKIVLSPHGIGPFLRLDGEPTAIGKAVFSAKITHGGTLTTLVITRIK